MSLSLLYHTIVVYFDIITFFQAKGNEQLWCERARRKVMYAIVEEWLKLNSNKTTVKKLQAKISVLHAQLPHNDIKLLNYRCQLKEPLLCIVLAMGYE